MLLITSERLALLALDRELAALQFSSRTAFFNAIAVTHEAIWPPAPFEPSKLDQARPSHAVRNTSPPPSQATIGAAPSHRYSTTLVRGMHSPSGPWNTVIRAAPRVQTGDPDGTGSSQAATITVRATAGMTTPRRVERIGAVEGMRSRRA